MDDTTLDQSYTPGLTSHTATLAEYHAVTTMFGADVPAKEIGAKYQATIDAQRAIAEAWASAHGLEINVVSEHEAKDDGRVAITTTWVVQIGRGDIDREQTPPGALDRWRWSARVGHWRGLLQGLGREGRRLAVREDGPELTVGLRKLLEAQDAFLRCGPPRGADIEPPVGVQELAAGSAGKVYTPR